MTAEQERIDTGADVMGSEGDKVGTVAYVVVRPPSLHVTDIVVSTGFLGRDVVVPIDQVTRVEGGKVYLSIAKSAMGDLPDYIEVHYETPPAAWGPPPGFYYPTQSVLWPAGTAGYYPEPSSVTVNAPAGTVGLSQGMDVESSDGHKIGSIKSVIEDPNSGDVTGIVVQEGFLFHHDVTLDAGEINAIHEGRVTLKETKDTLTARNEA